MGRDRRLYYLPFLTLLMMVSTVVSANDYVKITDLHSRIHAAGVSFLSPQEAGWRYKRTHQGRTEFGRLGTKEGQSYTGMITLSRLPHIESDEAFFRVVVEQRNRDSGNPRYEDIESDETLSRKKATRAVFVYKKYKDYSAKNLPDTSSHLVIEDIGMIFQHPYQNDVAVYVALSQRSTPEDARDAFEALALAFIESVEFSPFETE